LADIHSILVPCFTTASARIGDVEQQIGDTVVERQSGDTLTSTTGLEIESYDTVKTQQGRTSIVFLDDTRVDVTENSKLVIDEFVYDPNSQTGALSLKASIGTVRYASGQIAKNSRQNIKISTPTATIAVRGTDFSMTVNEIGSSTIILLPSCTIIANERVCVVGEIQVESDVGTVIMNQAFQATVVDTAKSTPLKPLLLKLDESFINNLLIITPPKQIDDEKNREAIKAVANILDLDLLVFEELNTDYLAEGEADRWQTDLDFDPLAGDFLFDALDQSMDNLVRQAKTDLDRKEEQSQTGIRRHDRCDHPEPGSQMDLHQGGCVGQLREDGTATGLQLFIDHNQNGNEIIDFEINPSGGSINNNITINQQN
jgi:hypothetical protein